MSFAESGYKVVVEHAPLNSAQVVSGNVTTGGVELVGTEKLKVGVWEHSGNSVSTDVENEEVFVVLSGKGKVWLEDGSFLELAPGVIGRFKQGEKTRWEIEETMRKVFIVAK